MANGIYCGNFFAINSSDLPVEEANWGYNIAYFRGEYPVVFAYRSFGSTSNSGLFYRMMSALPNGSYSWHGTWTPIATATPPQEYDLPLAEGKVVNGSCTYRKGQDGRLTLFVAVKRADGADLSGVEGAFTLPVGYRPLRQETRHIDLTDITGSPAGYAHLHIYPDGIANIAGIGGGAKSAFCECGFWTT